MIIGDKTKQTRAKFSTTAEALRRTTETVLNPITTTTPVTTTIIAAATKILRRSPTRPTNKALTS